MKNIEISSQIVENGTIQEPHNKYIEITDKNLSEFNKRLTTDVKLQYNHDERKFTLLSSPKNSRVHFLAKEFTRDLNRLVQLYQGNAEQNVVSSNNKGYGSFKLSLPPL